MSQIQVRMSLAPGLGPWGGHPKGCSLPDRTGQGRVGVVFHVHSTSPPACERRKGVRRWERR